MNKFIKPSIISSILLILIGYYPLFSADLLRRPSHQERKSEYIDKRMLLVNGYTRNPFRQIPKDVTFLIRCFTYGNPIKYKGKTLDGNQNLAEEDLSYFDFTGCTFKGINLTGIKLEGAILTDTTCDYEQRFIDNQNKTVFVDFALHCLNQYDQYFKGIYSIYPKLKSNALKIKLLLTASSFSLLPLCKTEKEMEYNAEAAINNLYAIKESIKEEKSNLFQFFNEAFPSLQTLADTGWKPDWVNDDLLESNERFQKKGNGNVCEYFDRKLNNICDFFTSYLVSSGNKKPKIEVIRNGLAISKRVWEKDKKAVFDNLLKEVERSLREKGKKKQNGRLCQYVQRVCRNVSNFFSWDKGYKKIN